MARSSACGAAARLGKRSAVTATHARPFDRDRATVKADLPLGPPQRCPVRMPERPWRGPHRRSASSVIMRESVAIPAVRQKRSKLAPTSCQASFTSAVVSGPGVVIILFMALPFFVE